MIFLVGNQGAFDRMVIATLKELKVIYTAKIRCTIVYAFLPTAQEPGNGIGTIYPEAVATAPPRFCIDRRNRDGWWKKLIMW